MLKFWVVGGTYRDSSFEELVDPAAEIKQGPFETYNEAHKAWQALAWESVDDALAQFHIEEEEVSASDGEFWVTGGRFADGGFDKLVGAPERFGPFKTYEDAKSKWSELAWQTVDEAGARYRIETFRVAAEEKPKLAYRLLTGRDDDAFCQRVSEALGQGYALYQSPSITYGPEGAYVAQAVILKAAG